MCIYIYTTSGETTNIFSRFVSQERPRVILQMPSNACVNTPDSRKPAGNPFSPSTTKNLDNETGVEAWTLNHHPELTNTELLIPKEMLPYDGQENFQRVKCGKFLFLPSLCLTCDETSQPQVGLKVLTET